LDYDLRGKKAYIIIALPIVKGLCCGMEQEKKYRLCHSKLKEKVYVSDSSKCRHGGNSKTDKNSSRSSLLMTY